MIELPKIYGAKLQRSRNQIHAVLWTHFKGELLSEDLSVKDHLAHLRLPDDEFDLYEEDVQRGVLALIGKMLRMGDIPSVEWKEAP